MDLSWGSVYQYLGEHLAKADGVQSMSLHLHYQTHRLLDVVQSKPLATTLVSVGRYPWPL